jgi:hypothetical protein
MARMAIQTDFRVLPKQYDFIVSEQRETLYSGGFGGGKTLALCLKAISRAMVPHAVEILARAQVEDLRLSVIPMLFEGVGDKVPPLLAPNTYTYIASQRLVRLNGGGVIRFAGLGGFRKTDVSKLSFRGANITGLGIDQAEELSEEQYLNAIGRVRASSDSVRPQIYSTCNPDGPSHFLAHRFGISDPSKKAESTLAILTSPFENWHLPPEYMALLSTYTGVMRDRYVLGKWVQAEGAVYPSWRRDKHVRERVGPFSRYLIFIDDGYSVPCALLFVGVDTLGRAHVMRSAIRSGMLISEKLNVVKRWQDQALRETNGVGIEAVIVDPSESQIKAEIREMGLRVLDGDNRIKTGISVVASAMENIIDGEPGLTVDPSCETLIAQTESYTWDSKIADRPLKVNDHGPDALRYGMMYLNDGAVVALDMQRVKPTATPSTGRFVLSLPIEDRAMRQQALAAGKRRMVALSPAMAHETPEVLTWGAMSGRGFTTQRHAMAAAFSESGNGPVLHAGIADLDGRAVIAEMEVHGLGHQAAAERLAMMALWFGAEQRPLPIMFWGGIPTRTLQQYATLYGVLDAGRWEPDYREQAEAMGLWRAALEAGDIKEPSAKAIGEAAGYVYVRGRLMPGVVLGDLDRVERHADRVTVRLMLHRAMLQDAGSDPSKVPSPFGTVAYVVEAAGGRMPR